MSDFKKKTLISDFKAIKLGIVLGLALLFGVFFNTGPVLASFEFFEDDFETYNTGDIAGQGLWKQKGGCNSWHISTSTTKSGLQSLGFDEQPYCNGNLKDGVGIATSTDGAFIFYFMVTTDVTNQKIFFFFTDKNDLATPEIYENYTFNIEINSQGSIYLTGRNTTTTLVAVTIPLNTWEKIEIEYNLVTDTARALLHGSFWSDYIPLRSDVAYINSYFIEGGDTNQPMFVDNIQWTTGETYTPPCGFGPQCQYCMASTTCATYNCIWSENFCWNTLPPDLPELEDCSGYGLTDRLTCEIKNFFYRLFVPSQEKIGELTATIDGIKNKFPYNYILEFKNFFSYLKDNVNESQAVNISILGSQSANLNFSFWNTTTSIAGSDQSIKDIIQKVFGFLIILIFGFWCFNFIKRIFK